ncbi:MAG: MarR family transcriptional regulator [Alphaproteobacteria bacterium]|nr:MarR family transcriptional regulator [Alphaproteobacteria bacterium]MBF0250035.1 MarR family transcriptional regulator [Alphaproteobacteria bacterium]
MGVGELNAVQALLLSNVGEERIAIRDLVERGYYQGSNVSYNIKKLTELGFLEQERSSHDRRSVMVGLTPKAMTIVERVRDLESEHAAALERAGLDASTLQSAARALQGLERTWTQYIQFGR